MIKPFVALLALGGTLVLADWGDAGLGVFGSPDIERTALPIGEDRGATRGAASLSARTGEPFYAPLARAVASLAAVATPSLKLPEPAVAPAAVSADEAATADADPPETAGSSTDQESRSEVPPDSAPTPPPETRVQLATLSTLKEVKEYPQPVGRPLETTDECLVPEICIDEYLWSLYERTPKIDTNKVTEKVKETVKKNGKTRTITRTITKYVVADFTWKDPVAAKRVGMSLKDYVIGGLDRGFKLKLFHALRAMDDAGFVPGITSAFRDDYRQSIASGTTAASDSSYHGGSRRGGYGRALAADIVSVRGETRTQRSASSHELWKWIDAHEKELGIGRPYLDRDPPHVAPIDGKEYADKRGRTSVLRAGLKTNNAKEAGSETKKRRVDARDNAGATTRPKPAKPPNVGSLQGRKSAEAGAR